MLLGNTGPCCVLLVSLWHLHANTFIVIFYYVSALQDHMHLEDGDMVVTADH